MISIVYMLIYFMRGNLPWQGMEHGEDALNEEISANILKCKEETNHFDLCKKDTGESLPNEFL